MKKERVGLGKGLSALIASSDLNGAESAYHEKFDIQKIEANPYQPRMHIKPDELVKLSDSIRENGVIQPLLITKNKDTHDKYHLIAGERRLRAAQLANIKHVPVVIIDSSPQQMLELALIENIQRKDLNSLEEATSYKQLQDQFGLTQTEIAKKMGLSRVAVTNKIRLLGLPTAVKEMVLQEKISEGHARALLGIEDEASLVAAANIIIKKQLSVRETEDLVRRVNFGRESRKHRKASFDAKTRNYLEKISEKIGYTTKIQRMAKGGKLTIRYTTNTELDDLLKKMETIKVN